MSRTTSEILVETLIHWKVEVIFGLPGDGINGIMEALRVHQDKIKFIQVRHEEAAAFAACGYSKFTGKLGALGAGDELEQIADVLGAPIIKALLGKACVPDNGPYTTIAS